MNLKDYPDRDMMMMSLADLLASELNVALMTHDQAVLAVPGGTTPGPLFDTLSAIDLEWDRVVVMLTDERWVPEHSERSNTALVRSRLLKDKAAKARFFPFYTGTETPEEALDELNASVEALLPISVLLLGMGDDMHIASLFPGADKLKEALADHAPPLMAMRAPGAPEPRLTLTAPALAGAMSSHIVVTGKAKREALERARKSGNPMEAPVAAVLSDATVHWSE